MSQLIRKQVYLTPEQDRVLRQRASELSITESAVIRLVIDQIAQHGPSLSSEAWQDELAFIHERADSRNK